MSCEWCIHWVAKELREEVGECRRFPQSVRTEASYFCGEFTHARSFANDGESLIASFRERMSEKSALHLQERTKRIALEKKLKIERTKNRAAK